MQARPNTFRKFDPEKKSLSLTTLPSPSLFSISLSFLFAAVTKDNARSSGRRSNSQSPPRKPFQCLLSHGIYRINSRPRTKHVFFVRIHHLRTCLYSDILVCGRDRISLDHPRFMCHDRHDLTASISFHNHSLSFFPFFSNFYFRPRER